MPILIQEGKLGPRNGIYITAAHYAKTGNKALQKSAHYAQMGNKVLQKISAASSYLKSLNKEDRIKILEGVKDDPLPEELLRNSVVVCPKDKLKECAISELQSNGLVMTETDI